MCLIHILIDNVCAHSSMVEHSAHNGFADGSIPSGHTEEEDVTNN